jgi:hypothetical protein
MIDDLQATLRSKAWRWISPAVLCLSLGGCLPVVDNNNKQAVEQACQTLRSLRDVVQVHAEPPTTPDGSWLVIVTANSNAAPTLESNAQTATNTLLGTTAAANVIVQRRSVGSQVWNVGPWQVSDQTRWSLVATGVGLLLTIAVLAALVAVRHRDQRGSNIQ